MTMGLPHTSVHSRMLSPSDMAGHSIIHPLTAPVVIHLALNMHWLAKQVAFLPFSITRCVTSQLSYSASYHRWKSPPWCCHVWFLGRSFWEGINWWTLGCSTRAPNQIAGVLSVLFMGDMNSIKRDNNRVREVEHATFIRLSCQLLVVWAELERPSTKDLPPWSARKGILTWV